MQRRPPAARANRRPPALPRSITLSSWAAVQHIMHRVQPTCGGGYYLVRSSRSTCPLPPRPPACPLTHAQHAHPSRCMPGTRLQLCARPHPHGLERRESSQRRLQPVGGSRTNATLAPLRSATTSIAAAHQERADARLLECQKRTDANMRQIVDEHQATSMFGLLQLLGVQAEVTACAVEVHEQRRTLAVMPAADPSRPAAEAHLAQAAKKSPTYRPKRPPSLPRPVPQPPCAL